MNSYDNEQHEDRNHEDGRLAALFASAGSDPTPPDEALLDRLREHRAWSKGELPRLIRQARREDHLERQPSGELRLSESGFGEASRTTRNHRLWELYLITHADIAPSHVDRDADMVEHILGAEMVHQLEAELDLQDHTLESPHSLES